MWVLFALLIAPCMSLAVLDDVDKTRGTDLHNRIPTARLPGLGQRRENPRVIHSEHKAEYVEFRKKVDEHAKGVFTMGNADIGGMVVRKWHHPTCRQTMCIPVSISHTWAPIPRPF
jgi:hypothetical protein